MRPMPVRSLCCNSELLTKVEDHNDIVTWICEKCRNYCEVRK